MILKSIISILLVFFIQISYAQKVSVRIKADRQYSHEAADIIFNVQVQNNFFKEYYIQDTSYIQKTTDLPVANFIWAFIEKKQNGKYKPGGFVKQNHGDPAPDSCSFYCCNCLLLKKGESIQFNVDFLSPYKLEKGEYRVYVMLHSPSSPATDFGVYTQFRSNYAYFTIK